MNQPERLRPELNDENSLKVREAIKDLYEREGIQISPQRLMNILVESVELLEFIHNVRIVIKQLPPPGSKGKVRKLEVQKKSNWMATFK